MVRVEADSFSELVTWCEKSPIVHSLEDKITEQAKRIRELEDKVLTQANLLFDRDTQIRMFNQVSPDLRSKLIRNLRDAVNRETSFLDSHPLGLDDARTIVHSMLTSLGMKY